MVSHLLYHISALATLLSGISCQDLDLSAVTLTNVFYQGPACQAGSLETVDFSNPSRFDLQFSPYRASLGEKDSVLTDIRKLCIIYIDLAYPANLQYGTVSMTYTGTVHLDEGFNAQIATGWYFGNGNEGDITISTLLQGPYDGDLTLVQEVNNATQPGDEIIWSFCGGEYPSVLHVQTSVRILNATVAAGVTAAGGSGWMARDGRFGVQLVWRVCEW